MNRSPRLRKPALPTPRALYPTAMERLLVNTGTVAVVAACAALAVVVMLAGRVLPAAKA